MAETAKKPVARKKSSAKKKTAAKKARVKKPVTPMSKGAHVAGSAAIATFIQGILADADGERITVRALSGNRKGLTARATLKDGKNVTITVAER